MSDLLYLSDQTLGSLDISSQDVLSAIEKTVLGVRDGMVATSPKSGITTDDGRYLMSTLAASDDQRLVAIKCVVANERSKALRLPAVNGGIMLLDSETGQLRAVLDANWVTGIRTAGMSLLAARHLANPDSNTLGLIGAGVQAESHLRAFAQSFPLNRVVAVGRGEKNVRRLESVAQDLNLTFEQSDAESTLAVADIVISTVTRDFSIVPFLDVRWLRPGAFAAMPDLSIPWLPEYLQVFDQVYIDDLAQERVMEKPVVASELVTGELADLVAGNIQYDPQKISAFVFRGTAAGDLAVASLAYHRAITGQRNQADEANDNF
ncbi:MAG: hypothetical protein KTR32_30590 [Granulosicoccus sp.]|nr:hypothetical protein [Granulosicoccus sp.]